MQKKQLISFGFLGALLVAGLLALKTPSANPAAIPAKEKSTCCKKAATQCQDPIKKDGPAESSLEHLSHQFISLPNFLY